MMVDLADKLAVAISVYNRWDELGGLLEVIRENWSAGKRVKIVVSTTATEKEIPAWIPKAQIDHLITGSKFTVPEVRAWQILKWWPEAQRRLVDWEKCRRKIIIRARTVDSIIRGCRAAGETKRKYTLHLHASTWPLDGRKVYQFVETMENNYYWFVGRGNGKKQLDEKHPVGDLDDNFFIVNNDEAKKLRLWDFNPAPGAKSMNNEGQIGSRVFSLMPEKRIYFFDDFSQTEKYEFPPGTSTRRMQPYNYYKPGCILRSHEMTKQAQYCRELGLKGTIIDLIIAGKATQIGQG